MSKNDYSIAINKNDDAIVVTYRREWVAKARVTSLGFAIAFVLVGITLVVTLIWLQNVVSVADVSLTIISFALAGGSMRRFLRYRRWLGEFERSTSEKRG
ncbi:MAG: hypothetical protein OEV52_05245 [Dehalococcoidia bacterium]|nr:hypothetical protein [Dehalococcoidia bacterium]